MANADDNIPAKDSDGENHFVFAYHREREVVIARRVGRYQEAGITGGGEFPWYRKEKRQKKKARHGRLQNPQEWTPSVGPGFSPHAGSGCLSLYSVPMTVQLEPVVYDKQFTLHCRRRIGFNQVSRECCWLKVPHWRNAKTKININANAITEAAKKITEETARVAAGGWSGCRTRKNHKNARTLQHSGILPEKQLSSCWALLSPSVYRRKSLSDDRSKKKPFEARASWAVLADNAVVTPDRKMQTLGGIYCNKQLSIGYGYCKRYKRTLLVGGAHLFSWVYTTKTQRLSTKRRVVLADVKRWLDQIRRSKWHEQKNRTPGGTEAIEHQSFRFFTEAVVCSRRATSRSGQRNQQIWGLDEAEWGISRWSWTKAIMIDAAAATSVWIQ